MQHARSASGASARGDRGLWQRVQALTDAQVEAVVGRWVTREPWRDVFTRRDALRKTIDSLVAKKGEAAVFLPGGASVGNR